MCFAKIASLMFPKGHSSGTARVVANLKIAMSIRLLEIITSNRLWKNSKIIRRNLKMTFVQFIIVTLNTVSILAKMGVISYPTIKIFRVLISLQRYLHRMSPRETLWRCPANQKVWFHEAVRAEKTDWWTINGHKRNSFQIKSFKPTLKLDTTMFAEWKDWIC